MNRRDVLKGLGAAGVVALAGATQFRSKAQSYQGPPSCVLTPEQTAGPFYFNVDQVRYDVTEQKTGAALYLALTVVDAGTCEPIPDAVVDIWHSDADGHYSGYARQGDDRDADMRGETFLRGLQITNAEGAVAFKTIYPGWYPGRVPHIHFKIHLNNQTAATSQLYFPEEITTNVHTHHPAYTGRGMGRTLARDGIFRRDGETLMMHVEADKDVYRASHRIGIAV